MDVSMILITEIIAFAILMSSENILKKYPLEFPISFQ